MDDPGEVVAVLVAREHDPGRGREDRVEQLVAVGVAGSADGVRVGHRAPVARAPTARRPPRAPRAASARASRTGRTARGSRASGSRSSRRRTPATYGAPGSRVPRLAAARARASSTTPSARTSRAQISASGSVPGSGSSSGWRSWKRVVGELEVEERRLRLLVLARGRQHVVGVARRLGHRDVDHDHELERVERLGEALRVGERVRRVGALDDHRAEAVRVVGEDLVGDHVAGHEPADDRARR